jgi:hypothetical protein
MAVTMVTVTMQAPHWGHLCSKITITGGSQESSSDKNFLLQYSG